MSYLSLRKVSETLNLKMRCASLRIVFGILCLAFPIQAFAATAFNAKVRDNYFLRESPEEEARASRVQVNLDEVVFVLGTSLNTAWVQVLKEDGQSGWITTNLLDL